MTGGGARILVVDDEVEILRAVRTNLGRHGFQVPFRLVPLPCKREDLEQKRPFSRVGGGSPDFRRELFPGLCKVTCPDQIFGVHLRNPPSKPTISENEINTNNKFFPSGRLPFLCEVLL